jgi:hypothetical protein
MCGALNLYQGQTAETERNPSWRVDGCDGVAVYLTDFEPKADAGVLSSALTRCGGFTKQNGPAPQSVALLHRRGE